MKVQLNQTWQDGAIVFPRFAVLEMTESAALALIAEGYGHRVPDDTRLFVSETLIDTCIPAAEKNEVEEKLDAPFKRDGEIELDDLPETAKQEARKKESKFFKK